MKDLTEDGRNLQRNFKRTLNESWGYESAKNDIGSGGMFGMDSTGGPSDSKYQAMADKINRYFFTGNVTADDVKTFITRYNFEYSKWEDIDSDLTDGETAKKIGDVVYFATRSKYFDEIMDKYKK